MPFPSNPQANSFEARKPELQFTTTCKCYDGNPHLRIPYSVVTQAFFGHDNFSLSKFVSNKGRLIFHIFDKCSDLVSCSVYTLIVKRTELQASIFRLSSHSLRFSVEQENITQTETSIRCSAHNQYLRCIENTHYRLVSW